MKDTGQDECMAWMRGEGVKLVRATRWDDKYMKSVIAYFEKGREKVTAAFIKSSGSSGLPQSVGILINQRPDQTNVESCLASKLIPVTGTTPEKSLRQFVSDNRINAKDAILFDVKL